MSDVQQDSLVDEQRKRVAEQARRSMRAGDWIDRLGILVPFVVVFVLGGIFAPNFLSLGNIRNVLVDASLTAIVGYGMTLAIALRGLDLSVGSIIGLSGCLTAIGVNAFGVVPGIAIGVLAGLAAGVLNGTIIAYLRVPAFVATLGTQGILRGSALLITGGSSIIAANRAFAGIATARPLGVPVILIVAIVLLAAAYLFLERTAIGRHIAAIGGRPEAAVDSGIAVRRVTLITFAVVGLAAGISGVLTASQLVTVDGTLGTGEELQIIAIAILGGTSLAGGSGNMFGTFVAAVLLSMVSAILNLLNIPTFYQYLAVGLLLLLALSLDSFRRRGQRNLLQGGRAWPTK